MEYITSIEQLIESFQDAEPQERGKVLSNIEIPTLEFLDFATWSDRNYTRNCLARCDEFEFILICWEGHSKTKIHDHANQDCWVFQVDGTLNEIRYKGTEDDLDVYQVTELTKGDLTYIHDKMGYHMIENPLHARAMTLHIYANPINACQVYNSELASFETANMEYDTIHELVEVL